MCQEIEKLGYLREVEERLTVEQWAQTIMLLEVAGWGAAAHRWWEMFQQFTHASAEQKIKALAAVIRGTGGANA